MTLGDRFFFHVIMRWIPPRDKAVQTLICRNCGKLRLMGDLRFLETMPCPKCNGTKFVSPKRFGWKHKMYMLYAALFRRKAMLFGIDEGGHDTFPSEPL